jgi:outer membrane protein TolC
LLAQANKRIETMQNRVDLAKEDNNPDFNVGGAYGFRSGHNANGSRRANLMSVRVSMTLPWFTQDKQDHQVEQRRANLAEAEFDYDDVKDAVLSEVSQTLDAYKQFKQQSLLFKHGIIPQSQQTVASMRAAYQVNKVDFLNLVRAQITLYNYEIQYWKVYAQAKQSEAKLHHMMGKEFENE